MNLDIIATLENLDGLLTGHFVLKSGKHSNQYLNKDVIYPYTDIMEHVGKALSGLALRNKFTNVQFVAGPEKGGIILAQWTAYAMWNYIGAPPPLAIYAEKTIGGFGFNRGYAEMIPNKRILLVEDIVTTGGSIIAVKEAIEKLGGIVVGIVALVNRGGVKIPNLHTLASLDVESWDAVDCPLCKQGVPINTNVGHGKKGS